MAWSLGRDCTPSCCTLVGAHGAALSLRNTATAPDGRRLDEHLATVLATQCGRITAIDSYLSDVEGMSAFFSEP
ncbi:hypothetical protein [Streptomyces sp. TP-A0356]|uniref:hypothetical protein n=1 Tax=Streptomyces sp. TP-A0356 TaxID=1359208 RepID=UPI0006E28C8E|nr:hypothetical protein [Streptomyces sp. TP-A0356]